MEHHSVYIEIVFLLTLFSDRPDIENEGSSKDEEKGASMLDMLIN
jgi:hypothetical protein